MAKLDFNRVRRMMTGTDTRDRYTIGNNTVAYRVRDVSSRGGVDCIRVELHGTPVAYIHHSEGTVDVDAVFVTLAGHPTVTTRDRINSVLREFVPRARCWQQDRRQYLDTGREVIPWDSSQTIAVAA